MDVRPSKRGFVILPSSKHSPENVPVLSAPVFHAPGLLGIKARGLGLLPACPLSGDVTAGQLMTGPLPLSREALGLGAASDRGLDKVGAASSDEA